MIDAGRGPLGDKTEGRECRNSPGRKSCKARLWSRMIQVFSWRMQVDGAELTIILAQIRLICEGDSGPRRTLIIIRLTERPR